MELDGEAGVASVLSGLQALTNPHRFEVLRLLRAPAAHFRLQAAGAPEEVGVCVSDLQEKLGLSQSTTSQYLAVLERAKLVTSHRVGQWTYWQSNAPEIEALVNFLASALMPAHKGQVPPRAFPALALQDAFAARARIRAHVRHTPLEPSPSLSRISGASVSLKWENLQFTRSCKPRGCFNRLMQFTPEERRTGVVTAAAGNYGLGLAYAGAQLGISLQVFAPRSTNPETVRLLREFGADVTFQADMESARRAAQEDGRVCLSGPADPAMIAGGGTVALELLDDFPDVEAVAVCATGGDLASGIGLVLKAARSDLLVYAVQTGPDSGLLAGAGRPRASAPPGSAASGLIEAKPPGTAPFVPFVDGVATVSDAAVRSAMQWAWEEHRLAVEPAGAKALAWVLSSPAELRQRRTAVIVTGGNASGADCRCFLGP